MGRNFFTSRSFFEPMIFLTINPIINFRSRRRKKADAPAVSRVIQNLLTPAAKPLGRLWTVWEYPPSVNSGQRPFVAVGPDRRAGHRPDPQIPIHPLINP